MSYYVVRRKAFTDEISFAGSSGWVRERSEAFVFNDFVQAAGFILLHVKCFASSGFTFEIVEVCDV